MWLTLRIYHLPNPFKKVTRTPGTRYQRKERGKKCHEEKDNFIKHFKGICICN